MTANQTKVVWITGAHGFLGRHVSSFFAERGYSVAGLDLHSWEADERARWKGAAWVSGDVSVDNLDILMGEAGLPAVVFHAAGSGSVGDSFNRPEDDFDRNVASTARILGFLKNHDADALFILPSSAAVYGSQPPGPIHEDVTPCPVSPYGFHKTMAEMLCRSAVENFGLSCAIIRYFSLYGPELRKQLLWDVSGRLMKEPEELVLYGTGDETRDMLYVEDAARLAFVLAENAHKGLQVVNGGTGVASSVRRIAELLIEHFGVPSKIRFNQEVRSGDPRHYQASIERTRALGFEPIWSLQDGVREFVAWFKGENVGGAAPRTMEQGGGHV